MKKLYIPAACAALLSACGGGGTTQAPEAQAQSPASTIRKAAKAPVMVQGSYNFDGRQRQSVVVEDRDGIAYWQGDIVLGRTADIAAGLDTPHKMHALGVYVTNQSRWQNGVLVYEANAASAAQQAALRTAMQHIALHSPVRFSRDTSLASYRYRPQGDVIYDLVSVQQTSDPALGGSSSVGRVGGTQVLLLNTSLSGNSGASVSVHELMHALGAWHEQSRSDRDSFVTVNRANVVSQYAFNFDTHVSDGANSGNYDYCSVMHYDAYAFTTGAGPTLVPKQSFSCNVTRVDESGITPVSAIGQRVGMSGGDMSLLSYLYGSAPAGRPIADAGDNQRLSGTSVTVQLDATRSRAMPGASIVKYQWNPVGWTPCSRAWECPNPVANANSARASVTMERDRFDGDVSAQYQLTVTDNYGRVMSDVVTVVLGR